MPKCTKDGGLEFFFSIPRRRPSLDDGVKEEEEILARTLVQSQSDGISRPCTD